MKLFTRIIAVVLTASLAADPALAVDGSDRGSGTTSRDYFASQALSLQVCDNPRRDLQADAASRMWLWAATLVMAAVVRPGWSQPAESYRGELRERQLTSDRAYIINLLEGDIAAQRSALRKFSAVHAITGLWTPEFEKGIVAYAIRENADPEAQKAAQKYLVNDQQDPQAVVDELRALVKQLPAHLWTRNSESLLATIEGRLARLEKLLGLMDPAALQDWLSGGGRALQDAVAKYRNNRAWALRGGAGVLGFVVAVLAWLGIRRRMAGRKTAGLTGGSSRFPGPVAGRTRQEGDGSKDALRRRA